MKFNLFTTFGLAATAAALALPNVKRQSISVTPHDTYSSSIGVLGCKINTNRVAYFPGWPDCNNLCVRVSHGGRSVNLLRVDSSASAYDISYDAWVYLQNGGTATATPLQGGGFPATMEHVPMSECQGLINDPSGKVAFSAANSMNTVTTCPADSFILYNIADTSCDFGTNDVCHIPPPEQGNQPICEGSTLGNKTPMDESFHVKNIQYGTGEVQST